MNAEILATGDEVRTGALVDTNSAYIADALERVGMRVTRHHCVGDDLDQLAAVLKEIGTRSDVAVVTGGLGPTTDDLTAEAAAEAAGVTCKLNPDAMASVTAFFERRKYPMAVSNKKQAYLPEGAECLRNPEGTAPGFLVKIGNSRMFFLPGVPHEMRAMLARDVLPRVKSFMGREKSVIKVRTLCSFGLTESATGERVQDIREQFPDIRLGLRARFPEIQVKFYASGSDESALDQRLDEAAEWVKKRIGNKLFSIDGQPMAAVVGELLARQKATLAVAESCTGGLISSRLTDVAGSSDYFQFAGVTYSNEAKVKVLGVSEETLKQNGAVHEQTAGEMADGARRLIGATYGLSTSGIAGPGGGTAEKPVGTICIGLATEREVHGWRFVLPARRRRMNKELFAMKALDLLRRELIGVLQK